MLISQIAIKEQINLKKHCCISQNDKAEIYLITDTNQANFVLKVFTGENAQHQCQLETDSLHFFEREAALSTPQVTQINKLAQTHYFLMEYMPNKIKSSDYWEIFGRQLALTHLTTNNFFGLHFDNYIGQLKQSNAPKKQKAFDFFIYNRLEPQFELARKKGFHFNALDSFYKNLENLISDEKPALIHGDLWHGNLLSDEKGRPSVIDTACCFAPRPMDWAMMELFGGFDSSWVDSYHEVYSMPTNWKKDLAIWQLYFLLVHLNSFGKSYYNPCQEIITKYR
ncbi:fructosamine kinase family protein [Mesonia sp. HuA40]|uniref:fructosamine kinase family protein n=1 Tax=Mesonia sp. HuA40 TaxID=2602761 RepID=UPI0011C6EF95|nr:fructosamine kinase family protein [Mesonia sp. HuA40]TXK73909.1 fructosamine kinase family protein [Mesonia sp. HuA40]